MKKNLLIVAALGGMFWTANEANAQETITGVVVEETPVLVQEVDCKDYYTPGSWKNNWFIQLGAGIRSPFMENYRNSGDNSRHLTAIYNLGVGRWISPYLGFRFSAYYGSMHWNQGVTASARVANLNVDFMWDMFNSIGGYKADRVFSIVPFIGLGGSFVYHYRPELGNIQDRNGGGVKSNQWLLPVSAGLQLRFRLSNYVDFYAEGRASTFQLSVVSHSISPVRSSSATILATMLNISTMPTHRLMTSVARSQPHRLLSLLPKHSFPVLKSRRLSLSARLLSSRPYASSSTLPTFLQRKWSMSTTWLSI